eukprot:gene5166-3714_t
MITVEGEDRCEEFLYGGWDTFYLRINSLLTFPSLNTEKYHKSLFSSSTPAFLVVSMQTLDVPDSPEASLSQEERDRQLRLAAIEKRMKKSAMPKQLSRSLNPVSTVLPSKQLPLAGTNPSGSPAAPTAPMSVPPTALNPAKTKTISSASQPESQVPCCEEPANPVLAAALRRQQNKLPSRSNMSGAKKQLLGEINKILVQRGEEVPFGLPMSSEEGLEKYLLQLRQKYHIEELTRLAPFINITFCRQVSVVGLTVLASSPAESTAEVSTVYSTRGMLGWQITVLVVMIIVFVVGASLLSYLLYRYGRWRMMGKESLLSDVVVLHFRDFDNKPCTLNIAEHPEVVGAVSLFECIAQQLGLQHPETLALYDIDCPAYPITPDTLLRRDNEFVQRIQQTARLPLLLGRLNRCPPESGHHLRTPAVSNPMDTQQSHVNEVNVSQVVISNRPGDVAESFSLNSSNLPTARPDKMFRGASFPSDAVAGSRSAAVPRTAGAIRAEESPAPLILPSRHHVDTRTSISIHASRYTIQEPDGTATLLDYHATVAIDQILFDGESHSSCVGVPTAGPFANHQFFVYPEQNSIVLRAPGIADRSVVRESGHFFSLRDDGVYGRDVFSMDMVEVTLRVFFASLVITFSDCVSQWIRRTSRGKALAREDVVPQGDPHFSLTAQVNLFLSRVNALQLLIPCIEMDRPFRGRIMMTRLSIAGWPMPFLLVATLLVLCTGTAAAKKSPAIGFSPSHPRVNINWTGMDVNTTITSKERQDILNSNLVLTKLIVINRHGHRAPNAPYWKMCPNDASNKKRYDVAAEDLSGLGMQEEYEFGQFIRGRYRTFLGDRFNRTLHYFRAVGEPRILQSAMAVAQGIFPDGFGPAGFLPSRPQFVPIFSDMDTHEYLLDDVPCFRRAERDSREWIRDKYDDFLEDPNVKETVSRMRELCGTTSAYQNTFAYIKTVADGLVFNSDLELNVCGGKLSPDLLYQARNVSLRLLMDRLYNTDEQQTYTVVDLPRNMLTALNHTHLGEGTQVNDFLDTRQESTFYFVHRESLYALAQFFGFQYRVPGLPPGDLPVASSLIIEKLMPVNDQFSHDDSKSYVRLTMRTPKNGMFTIPVPGCRIPLLCELRELIDIYNARIKRTGSWEQLCDFKVQELDHTTDIR